MTMERESDLYGTTELQEGLLQLLKEFDDFCGEHEIRYSLGSGSLLGAIRHNGFIPWDDDVDVIMSRGEYSKLMSLWNNTDRCNMNRRLWVNRIQRVRDGVPDPALFIDLFVLDNCPSSKITKTLKALLIRLLQGMMHEELELSDKSFFQKALLIGTWLFGRLFTDRFKYQLYDRISQWKNGSACSEINCYNDLFSLVVVSYDADLFDSIIQHVFETLQLPIIEKWDHYLTRQYGDYMTPPPGKQIWKKD